LLIDFLGSWKAHGEKPTAPEQLQITGTEALMSSQRGTPRSAKLAANSVRAFSESSFEKMVDSLKLSPEQYQSSFELREWVLRNKDDKYVPPELLKAYGFQVNLEP
jgi:hypothetical protein